MFKTIMGIDILPGESPEKGEPRFSVVLLCGNNVVSRYTSVGLRRLLKLISKSRPDAIALDNIFEISTNTATLKKILLKMSRYSEIVQVTRTHEGYESLEHLAKKHGLIPLTGGKLDPLKSAEVIARLAMVGIGSRVLVTGEETLILVTRGRSIGSGGMSARRYERNLNTMVLRATNEIKHSLEEAGIDYDLFVRKGEGGLVRSLFIAYTSRRGLQGIVKSSKTHDLKIVIKPVIREEIQFEPLKKPRRHKVEVQKRYLMVGVDPGMATGVAIMDLSGSIISVFSRRGLSRNSLLELLLKHGKPILIATDVNPPPEYVKKLATSLAATLFYPKRTLTIDEKRREVLRVVEKTSVKITNNHERDALAAVLKAYERYNELFKRAENEINRMKLKDVKLDEVKALIVRGRCVKEAIDLALKSRVVPKVVPYKPQQESQVEKKHLVDEINRLKTTISKLERELKKREELIEELRRKVYEMRSEKFERILREETIVKLISRINRLEEERKTLESMLVHKDRTIDRWKSVLKDVLDGRAERIVPFESLMAKTTLELYNDIVFIKNPENIKIEDVNLMYSIGVRGVIVKDSMAPHLKQQLLSKGIPVLELSSTNLKYVVLEDGLVISSSVRKILDNMREELRREVENSRELWRILEEYRKARLGQLE